MNRIKQLREEKGESLEDLHNATNIPKSSLSEYEKGPRTPRKKEIWESLAEHFKVSVPYIMGVSENRMDTKLQLDNELPSFLYKDGAFSNSVLANLIDNLNSLDNQLANEVYASMSEYLLILNTLVTQQDGRTIENFIAVNDLLFSANGIFANRPFVNMPILKTDETTKSGYKMIGKIQDSSFEDAVSEYLRMSNDLRDILDNYFSRQLKNKFDKK